MFSTYVYMWNSVDISKGENERYSTRGIVVDKSETGLFVDFDIANKQPELIAFDRIIHSDEITGNIRCALRYEDCGDCEVLLQLSADQPWTWYPAEKLAGSRTDSFVLVKAKVSDGHSITDVVRTAQVRCCRCAKYRSVVLFNDYLKEHVNVAADDFVVTPLFRKLWTGERYYGGTYPVGIVNKRFYYMQRRERKGLNPAIVVKDVEDLIVVESMRQSITNKLRDSHGVSEKEDIPHRHIDTKTELAISDIPHGVLHVVLSHLDIVQLARYRRVCPLWNSVITSTDSSKVIMCDMGVYKIKDSYSFATVLFKLVKETTMYLIFTRRTQQQRKIDRSWCSKSLQLTKTILDQTGITIPTLVLADLELDKSALLEQRDSKRQYEDGNTSIITPEVLRSICQRLVFVRVTVLDIIHLSGKRISIHRSGARYATLHGNLEIPYADIRTVDITQQSVLSDIVELSAQLRMQSVDNRDMERLRDWISKAGEVVTNPNSWNRRIKIMQVLQRWEAEDRRFGRAFCWKDAEAAQLSNKLDTLHSITVLCLLYGMEQYAQFGDNFRDNLDSVEDVEEEDSD